ncbi:V-snare-domain-containing protein [Rhizoclosmatium globosum]|uniref:V-snare-domain-containing protein n=1 Tax=Rhizoclosmatium globosum TaxID=329046 RepID=A0A1Y2BXW0_9FUNG|nr:hypothetical protein HDU79_005226 [Rhizoclosmatium sp. JEL0117]ORY39593.1 V-snare-domain-containing protein [Rhizoclosmatium globosum]|eukprot:ORY39593.1 V-snare-domain-containing protein [Rhizoclosmatium globosum]
MDQLRIEFEALRQAVRTKLDVTLPTLLSSEASQERRLVVNQATRDLEEADEIIAEMETVAKTLPTQNKLKATALIRSFRETLRIARKDLQKAASPAAAERFQLLSGANESIVQIDAEANDQRTRLLRGTETLQSGSERLQNIQRIALESETVGVSTLSDLNRQREQLQRTRNTLDGADTWIAQSTAVIRGMQWQYTKGSLIQYGTIAILSILILIAIYFKYFR